jgi:multidrug efflux pump subunit AcrA (membrane-fusion protein)
MKAASQKLLTMNPLIRMNKNIKIVGFAMMVGLLAACGGKQADEKAASKPLDKAGLPAMAVDANVAEVSGIGRVEPEGQIIPLAASDAGIVTKVLVQDGQRVKAGDLLLELDHRILDAQIDQARRRIATQSARIRTDEKSLIDAQLRLANLKANLGRTENLVRSGAEIAQNLSDQRSEAALQENAILRWQTVIEGDRAQMRELEGDIAVLAQQLEYKVVRAPMDGRLLTVRALQGSFVSAQVPFADFAPDGKTVVRCEIDEMYAGKLAINQSATIKEMGTGKELAKAHVIYAADFLKRKSLFSELAGEMEDRRVREVKVLIDSGESLLYNSRVECFIAVAPSTTD